MVVKGINGMKKVTLISCFGWFENRLKPIKEVLENDGYIVSILVSDYDHINKAKIIDKVPECNYISVKEYKKNISFGRLYSHYSFSREVLKKLKKIQPDLVYALLPPNSVAQVCKKYKVEHPNCSLVFDVIDMWPESLTGGRLQRMFPLRYWKQLRDKSFELADHIFTECNLYKDKFDLVIRSKCSTLYLFKNDIDVYERPIDDIEEYKMGKPILRLCYLGSINHIIDIDGICSVVRQLTRDYYVEVRIIGKGENKDTFITELEKVGADTEYCGAIYDELQKYNLLRNCDYALNMMIENVNVGLTIKSIDYLSYGIPLINNIKGDTWQLIENENIGINYEVGIDIVKKVQERKVKSHDEVYKTYKRMFSKEAFLESFMKGMKDICV